MKLYITFIFSLVFSFITFSQEDLFYKGSQIKYTKVDSDYVAIMQRPVTNREYIIYIMWMKLTFEPSYPEIFLKCIPGLNMDTLEMVVKKKRYKDIGRINRLIKCCEPFVNDYMFNPKYLDYPVVGVSWQNANNYGKWYADRCNEVKLIKKGYLGHVTHATERDYFNTDAYVVGMWEGQIKRKLPTGDKKNPERDFNWSDNVFVPVFRLPTEKEMATTPIDITFKAYPMTKKNFLYEWRKQFFINETDTSYVLSEYYDIGGYPEEKINCRKNFQLNYKKELCLEINKKMDNENLLSIYKRNEQVRLLAENYVCCYEVCNKFYSEGILNPYMIICEDKEKNPIFVTAYKDLQPANYKEFKIFRLACSATPKQLGVKIK